MMNQNPLDRRVPLWVGGPPLLVFVLVCALVFGYHHRLPGGSIDTQLEAYARMDAAHAAGDHRAVVEIYRGRLVIPFAADRELHTMEDQLVFEPAPDHLYLMVGDAYRHLGNAAEAQRYYLKSLDWTVSQYRTFCRVSRDCLPLDELARSGLAPQPGHQSPHHNGRDRP